MGRLTAAEREAFAADGVICVRGLVGAPALERLRRLTDAHRERPAALFTPSGRPLPDSFLWLVEPEIGELLADSAIPALAGELLGVAAPRLFYDQIFAKVAGASAPTPWHQDAPYWPITGEALSVWLALDPVDQARGGVRYIPGSQRAGVTYRPTSRQHQEAWEGLDYPPMPDFDADPPAALRAWELAPGDAIVHHARTIHASGANTVAGAPRRAYVTRWLGADVRYAPRPETMEFPLGLGLEAGAPMAGPLFPALAWRGDEPG